MGRPKIDNKKETKSFRVDPRLWKLVQAEAKSSNKRSTDVINEALARHLGGVLRGKMDLDNEKLVHFLNLWIFSENLGAVPVGAGNRRRTVAGARQEGLGA